MRGVGQDLRFAARRFIKDKGFTILAAVALGLGIGVNTTFFSLVNAALFRGFGIDASEDVMFISLRDARNVPRGLSFQEYEELRSGTRAFAAVGAYSSAAMTLVDEGTPPQRVAGASLSASGIRALGVRPLHGRELGPADDRPGAPAVVLLSERLWRTRYRGEQSAIGRSIMLNGAPATVIGVMPERFRFPGNTDVWRPLVAAASPPSPPRRDERVLSVFGRVGPSADIRRARVEFDSLGAAWAQQDPALYAGLRPSIVPINEQLFGRVTDTVWLAFITAGALVLVIACANVANLLLMRAAGRGREVAIRLSLGATRSRILRQLLLESALLALLGAASGLAFSVIGLRMLQTQVPADVATLFDFTFEARVMTALVAASAASIVIFGLAPAVHLARGATAETLKDGGRGSEAITRRRWATVFLAAEFALTLVLLANVAMGIRIAAAAREAQFPIDPEPLLTMSITLPNQPYGTADARRRFFDGLQETVGGLPSVSAVAIASILPGSGTTTRRVTIAGRPPAMEATAPRAGTIFIGERYFDAIAAPVVRGRAFNAADGTPGQETAIVNAKFVELFLAGDEPLDTLIRVERAGSPEAGEPWLRVVGVAPSIRQSSADGIAPDPVVYLPAASAPPATTAVVVRAAGNPALLAQPIREAVGRLDPALPVDRVVTMGEAVRQLQWNGRISRVLLDGIGTIALLLALVGLYAVTAHSVRLRRRELGIRMALGAAGTHVAVLVLRRAMAQLAIGLGVGVGATVGFERMFMSPATRLTDPSVILPTVAAIVVVGAAACLWPASRAARWDPAVVLRDE